MPDRIEPFLIGTAPTRRWTTCGPGCGATRWPERETVNDWSQGVPLDYLQDLCRYWAGATTGGRPRPGSNAIPQFTTTIDGLGVHFLHVRSPHPDAIPLIMTHGWPGSFLEFERTLGRWPTRSPTAAPRPTRSTWSSRRCRATGSAASRPPPGGTSTGSPAPGPG